MSDIFELIQSGDIPAVKKYLRKHHVIDIKNKAGETPMIKAVQMRNVDMLDCLLAFKPDLFLENQAEKMAIQLAKRRPVHQQLLKHLVVAHLTRDGHVEATVDDSKRRLINKIITSLLYESKRHSRNSVTCHNLNYYLCCLDPKFKDFSQDQLSSYIRQQETDTMDHFGSYLSDDSDSDDEAHWNKPKRKAAFKQKNQQALSYTKRAQLDKLFYKRATKSKQTGDLKEVKEGSTTFDINQRTKICYGKTVNTKQVKRDLARLNRLLKRGHSLEEAQAELETRFCCAQYRGVTHLTNKWNAPSRRAQRKYDEVGKPQYSASVYENGRISIFRNFEQGLKKIESQQEQLQEKAMLLKEILLSWREARPCSDGRYSYSNYACMMQNLYSQDYDGFHLMLQKNAFLKAVLFNASNPFVSTGDTPYHALKYAYGIKPYKGHEHDRLRPRWTKARRAERPYSGVTYVSLHPLSDYDADGPLHLVSLNRNAEINIKKELMVMPERESCFPAFIPEQRVIHKHVAKYPSFTGAYKKIFLVKYGITSSFYKKLQFLLKNAPPHSSAMTSFKKILGEWLCSYQEVRLIDIAREEAEKRGMVMIYRDCHGGFTLTPPVDSVNRNTSAIKQDEKDRIKLAQKKRKEVAAGSDDSISLIDEEMCIAEITATFDKLRLTARNDDYSVHESENGQMPLVFAMLLNTIKNRRNKALAHFLQHPMFIAEINRTIKTSQFNSASLLHIAIAENNLEAFTQLIACDELLIQKTDETINDSFHHYNYYEQISPLALTIIQGNMDMFTLCLESGRFKLDEKLSAVRNKDLIDDKLDMSDENDDEDFLGLGWSQREAFNIIRTRDIDLLQLACRFGRNEMVVILMEKGLSASHYNSRYENALNEALWAKHFDVAMLILQRQPELLRQIPLRYRSHVYYYGDSNDLSEQAIPKRWRQLLCLIKKQNTVELLFDDEKCIPRFGFFKANEQAIKQTPTQMKAVHP